MLLFHIGDVLLCGSILYFHFSHQNITKFLIGELERISESFSYVLLAGIVGTLVAATLGMTLLRAFVENGPTSMMMTFQITLLPALIMLILFLALAFIVPVVALRLFNNRSVVERLRVNE